MPANILGFTGGEAQEVVIWLFLFEWDGFLSIFPLPF